MSEEAKWYVVHTYSSYENKVASTLEKVVENRNLQDYIKEIIVPTEIVTEVKEDGTVKEVEQKIFPGYVIIKMIVTDESWYAVRNIRGCTGFVGTATDPLPLSDEEVARLGVEKRSVKVSYKIGDTVQLVGEPFDGFVGTVADLDIDAGTVRVVVSMFGQETPADLDLSQVRPITD
ncbi:MAG: transcription termination/antitermination protein NusG [Clostridia bacterium]